MARESYTSHRNSLIRTVMEQARKGFNLDDIRQNAVAATLQLKDSQQITIDQYDKLYTMWQSFILMQDLEQNQYFVYKSKTRAVYNPITRATSITW